MKNLLTEWSALLLRSFADAGVRDVVISPGSRSTPFVAAAVREPRLRCHSIIDERAASFFALGQARLQNSPTLLLCTSGTAGAHYLPAIIEAGASFIPLLILTADRPTELQDCAAPQTIDQTKLFGDHVRHFFDIGMPDSSELALSALRRIAFQSTHATRSPTPGAVHLNARARKPLEPVEEDNELTVRARNVGSRMVTIAEPRVVVTDDSLHDIAIACGSAKRGIILCGPAPLTQTADRDAIFELARATAFPIVAEATSQIRFAGGGEGQPILDTMEPLLRSPARFRERFGLPDLVLQIGRPPTSTGWETILTANPGIQRVVIARHGWNDPASSAAHIVFGEPGQIASELAKLVTRSSSGDWSAKLLEANAQSRAVVDQILRTSDEIFSEGLIVRSVVETAPSGSLLALGNSLAVRLVDTFGRHDRNDLGVLSQRGASGIDGLVAGAAGAASCFPMGGDGRAVTLLLGDVSLLHDLTSLAVAVETSREANLPIVIVVVQNYGGRIFEQLPLASAPAIEPEILERTITPHRINFEPAAQMFGAAYARPTSNFALIDALTSAYQRAQECTLIEVVVPPHGAAEEHRRIVEAAAASIL
jgi:2-succinyl-5-enolpyruvyl-6-hydroxy-3-cyclohexene-1-carboxylate synthase